MREHVDHHGRYAVEARGGVLAHGFESTRGGEVFRGEDGAGAGDPGGAEADDEAEGVEERERDDDLVGGRDGHLEADVVSAVEDAAVG